MIETLLEIEARIGIQDYNARVDSVGVINDPLLAQDIAEAFAVPYQRSILMGEKAEQLRVPDSQAHSILLFSKTKLKELKEKGFTEPTEFDDDLEQIFKEEPYLRAEYQRGEVKIPADVYRQAASDEAKAELFYKCRLLRVFQRAQRHYEISATSAATMVYFRHIAAQNLVRYRTVLTDQDLELFGPSLAIVQSMPTRAHDDDAKKLDRGNQALRSTLKMRQDVFNLAELLGRNGDDTISELTRPRVAKIIDAIAAFGILPLLIANEPEKLPEYFQEVYRVY